MNFALAPYLFVLLLSVAVCWFIGFYAWRRRDVNAAIPFMVLMFSAGFWAFFYGMELITPGLPAKLVYFNIKQLGASILGPSLLIFILRFTRQRIRFPRFLLILLAIEPVVTQIIFWTNPQHGLAGTPYLIPNTLPFPVLFFEYNTWFWLSVFIGHLLFVESAIILMVRFPAANKFYRKQLTYFLIGMMVPWGASIAGMFGVFNWHLLDIVAFFFWVGGVLIGLGLFRYQLLQLSPVAHTAVFTSIRDGIIVLDVDGRILQMNPAALKLLGARDREIMGQHIASVLPIPSAKFLNKDSRKREFNLEFFYEQNGQNRFLEAHGAPLTSDIYVASGYVFILYDVTERVLAEKAWEFSENRYRTIFETDSAATIIIEPDMTISLANEQFATLAGCLRKDIEGKVRWTDFVHEDDLPRMKHFHVARRLGEQNVPSEYEFRFVTGSGVVRDVHISIAMVPDSQISIASLLDITDRKLAEQILQQRATELEAAVLTEQERSAIILKSISDAIAVSDLDHKIIYVNPAFIQLTGYSSEEILGKPSAYRLNGRLPALTWQQLQKAFERQTIWEGEMSLKRKDGSAYDAAVLIAPVYDGKKSLIGYVSSHRDITGAKQLEESRRRFVTNISHELRTPVTNLKLYTDLLRRHFDSSRRDHYFAVLGEQIDRLERIIKNTLEISRLEDKYEDTQREMIRWDNLCRNVQERLKTQAEENRITLRFEAELRQLPGCMGDPQRLSQALYELIYNAIRFTQPGGTIIVSGRLESGDPTDWIAISVCDDGPGIESDEQIKIFDRFFRGQLATAGHLPGTGLGLSMVKLIAEAHNGRITLNSTPGQGSIFTIWLPLT